MSWFKKQKDKKLKKEAIPQLFLVLGFFSAALLTEVMNILHELAKAQGNTFFVFYACIILFFCFYVIIQTIRIIENLYEKKNKK